MAVQGSGAARRTSAVTSADWSSSRDEVTTPRSFLAAETSEISDEAKQLRKLQQLQEEGPEKFRSVASHISDAFSSASKSQPGSESSRLNRLADVFNPTAPIDEEAPPSVVIAKHRFA